MRTGKFVMDSNAESSSEILDRKGSQEPHPESHVADPVSPHDSPTFTYGKSPTPVAPAPSQPGFKLPKKIGKYQIRTVVGVGGFGTVYLGWDPVLQREVAIKVPRGEIASIPKQRERFLEEARIVARVRDPGIVVVHDFGVEHDRDCYVVYEYIQGESLRDRLRRGRPSVTDAVQWIIQIAEALHAAHKQGLIHRDVKPSNILLNQSGRALLTDFGLAVSEETQRKLRGEIAGTTPYMAPEQLQGDVHFFDGRTDLWALGVVFYELLTGRLPFTGNNPTELAEEIRHRSPRPPRQINDTAPRFVEAACLRCLEKDVSARYLSALDLAQDLQAFQQAGGDLDLSPRPAVVIPCAEEDWAHHETTPFPSIDGISNHQLCSRLKNCCTTRFLKSVFGVALMAILAMGWLLNGTLGTRTVGSAAQPQAGKESQKNVDASTPAGNGMLAIEKPLIQTVRVTTKPPGAEVVFFALDPNYGWPDPKKAFAPTKDMPTNLQLPPGDYLVVAVLNDGRFHEVMRRVPQDPHVMTDRVYKHLGWTALADGVVELPEIVIPQLEVVHGMASFSGSPDFQMGLPGDGSIPPHRRRVPAFLLECREVTYREILDLQEGRIHPSLGDPSDARFPLDDPAIRIWYDDAAAFAEKVGKRLPSEGEYEFAATLGGTRRFPAGDDAALYREWQFGSAGQPDFDELPTDPPVRGLFSNVAEWTSSWFAPYPPRLDRYPKFPPRRAGEYVVRGGSMSVTHRNPSNRDWLSGPRIRSGQGDRNLHPGLGFRCARSVKPRLIAEDFEQVVSVAD